MEKNKSFTFQISLGIILVFLLGGFIGYSISNKSCEDIDEESQSPISRIQFNVNENELIEIPETYLSEKISEYFFIIDDEVRFYGLDSFDPDGIIDEYKWYFSNAEITEIGKPSETDLIEHGRIVERTFHRTGTFWVNLTVIDNDGLMNTTTIKFEVRQKPFVKIRQDGAWLNITQFYWSGGPVETTQELYSNQITLWFDESYNSNDNFLPGSDGFEDYWGYEDVDQEIDGCISKGDRLSLSGLYSHSTTAQFYVTLYYNPYEVDHLGLPTMIYQTSVNNTLVIDEIINTR